MIVSTADVVDQSRPRDEWGTRRIWIAGAFGTIFSGSQLILDFWPLGPSNSLGFTLRGLFDLFTFFLILPLAGLVVGLVIAAGVALWRRHFRRLASSILAIAALPICVLVIAKVPVFDPWLWYAMANSARFETLVESNPSSAGSRYAIVEVRDVSTGLAGLNPNHFIAIIYDESDAIGLEPSERPNIWRTRSLWPVGSIPIPKGSRLYDHLFRVDDYE